MSTLTALLLILSVIVAGALAYFQYFYKSARTGSIRTTLAILRFIGCLGLLVLLINPIITRNKYEIRKIPLAVLADNSSSVKELGADETLREMVDRINESGLTDRFDLQTYRFDQSMEPLDSLNFKGKQTDPDAAARSLEALHRNSKFPTILISDGNQTRGSDYTFSFRSGPVFPLVVGDTVQHADLRIERINVNKYAYLNNQFPVEVFLRYSGPQPITAQFSITQGSSIVSRQSVPMSPSQPVQTLRLLLPAQKAGVMQYVASVSFNGTEKNTYNNTKRFAVEVMDQKSGIALVSAIAHPDLGAIRRSIETNAQRTVTLVKPHELKDLSPYNVLILYQPVGSFKPVYELNKKAQLSTLTITGMATDFDFLNREQSVFSFRNSRQPEDYQAVYESGFSLFAQDDIRFGALPPLEHPYGTISSSQPFTTLLSASIRNIGTGTPLLAFNEGATRQAFLMGENIWKWRLHLHNQNNSFEEFDRFMDKTIQFLATSAVRKSLVVTHERFYNSGDAIEIIAQFFNKNYEFDHSARLSVSVKNKQSGKTRNYDMLKGVNSFKASLDGLEAGSYQLTVRENQSNSVYTGGFEVLEFDIEKQFVNADTGKLRQLAQTTGGVIYTPDAVDNLIKKLMTDEQYKPIQKRVTRKSPLIDWIWLLVIIAGALGAEWLLRKYHGML
jgi:hypothetical protein